LRQQRFSFTTPFPFYESFRLKYIIISFEMQRLSDGAGKKGIVAGKSPDHPSKTAGYFIGTVKPVNSGKVTSYSQAQNPGVAGRRGGNSPRGNQESRGPS
jgi:hypothetical protein